MKEELAWESRPLNPYPPHWITQWIIHTTVHLRSRLEPWRYDWQHVRGYQKRTFLHQ